MSTLQKQKTKRLKTHKNARNLIKLIPGLRLNVKITALGPNNIGINEFSYGMPILVPNAKLGETVQVKIVKIDSNYNVAIAKLVKTVTKTSVKATAAKKSAKNVETVKQASSTTQNKAVLKAGEVIEVTLSNKTGIIDVSNSYQNVKKVLLTPKTIKSLEQHSTNSKISLRITRLKSNYAFALLNSTTESGENLQTNSASPNTLKRTSLTGSKFTIVLPKTKKRKSTLRSKNKVNYLVFKVKASGSVLKASLRKTVEEFNSLNKESLLTFTNGKASKDSANTILFVKSLLGAKAGDKVQIQITKFIPSDSSTNKLKSNVAIAKIIKLNPMSGKQKKALVFASLRQMLKSGMHYGEKAIKCNARMKNYVWIRKKGQNSNKPLIKKGRNVINLLKTRRCLNKALAQLAKYAAKGKTFLFVGTKKSAAGLVARASLFSKKAFFVNTRWLGGMLTNWKTIVKSISKIRPILKEKQVIIKDILQKRQNIKARLIQKALLLRKKSKLMLTKGRQLIQFILSNARNSAKQGKVAGSTAEQTNILNAKRKELISKGVLALEKRQQLLVKRQELILQSQNIKSKAVQLKTTYRQLVNNLIIARKKVRELKALLLISKELQTVKALAKQENQNLYMVSYNKFRTLQTGISTPTAIIANPPKEILNKMVAIVKGITGTDTREILNLKSAAANPNLYISQLLSKFNLFIPTIKKAIANLQQYSKTIQEGLTRISSLFSVLKAKMANFVALKAKIVTELQQIKTKLQTERNIIRVLKRKLKQISSQRRLIKFLPKLRYLPTPTQKIEQTARFLMKKFVDPKMKYPIDSIYDEKLSRQSKKVAASRKKKWQRLEKYLGGISNMTKLKDNQTNQFMKNTVAVIIGQQEEMNAVRECQKLGIKMFHVVDTNCNPGFADHFIPANDDARNSIKFILAKFLTRIRLAQKLKAKFKKQSRSRLVASTKKNARKSSRFVKTR